MVLMDSDVNYIAINCKFEEWQAHMSTRDVDTVKDNWYEYLVTTCVRGVIDATSSLGKV